MTVTVMKKLLHFRGYFLQKRIACYFSGKWFLPLYFEKLRKEMKAGKRKLTIFYFWALKCFRFIRIDKVSVNRFTFSFFSAKLNQPKNHQTANSSWSMPPRNLNFRSVLLTNTKWRNGKNFLLKNASFILESKNCFSCYSMVSERDNMN